jgi:hypothetical protein
MMRGSSGELLLGKLIKDSKKLPTLENNFGIGQESTFLANFRQ